MSQPPPTDIQVFQSRDHPGGRTARRVYTEAFLRPLAGFFLPLMIATVVAALQMRDLRPFLFVGFPLAFLLAALWTRFMLGRRKAEIFIQEGFLAYRSVQECLAGKLSVPWYPVLEVRIGEEALSVTTTDSTHILKRARWPEAERLEEALVTARRQSSQMSYPYPWG